MKKMKAYVDEIKDNLNPPEEYKIQPRLDTPTSTPTSKVNSNLSRRNDYEAIH